MRENSGSGQGGSNSRDPTLNENAGTRPAGSGGDPVEGAPFEVAADRTPEGGARSPSGRGRGEVANDDEIEPDND